MTRCSPKFQTHTARLQVSRQIPPIRQQMGKEMRIKAAYSFFLTSPDESKDCNEKKKKKKRGRVAWRQCNTRDTVAGDRGQAQRKASRETKIRIITILLRRVVSEIKLKRTDTTLDLSQKAKRAKEEKKENKQSWAGGREYIGGLTWSVHDCDFWSVCKLFVRLWSLLPCSWGLVQCWCSS
ncbi:hypothetical protein QBC35DRAFT_25747 [Podospora australis]|uniref:Uncharacterized protein n=1 Tax=Podospora australis TaxID=1536484 RepID=A0AAN6WZW4_9PEZI|nr:hypothetical protein QBC35DRAFT_25747 [Podospora australis]